MSRFRRVQALISQLPEDHYATGLRLTDPIVPALEYFLSLEQVAGFEKKLEDLKRKPVGPLTAIEPLVQWASLCAELGGISLLGRTLGLQILGFDRPSPRAQRANSDCDVVILLNGREAYIEIKRRASEDRQSVPKLLEERLVQLQSDLAYGISMDFHPVPEVRQADWPDAETLLADARQHVEAFEYGRSQGEWFGEEVPPSIGAGPIILSFYLKPKEPLEGLLVGFSPDCVEVLKPYLVGPGEIGGDGKPMIPVVQQAIEKGADYLLCRVSPWDGWREIVEGCFGRLTWTNPRACFAPEICLRNLRGVVLFSRYDDFCVVNNSAAEDCSWFVGQLSIESALGG